MPPWRTKYTVLGDVLSMGFSHYSPDVPCDFADFVDHLTFHLCILAYDDVYQGLDHLASHWSITPFAYDFLTPFTWSGTRIIESMGSWCWSASWVFF